MKKNYKLSLTAIAVGLAGILQLSPVLLPNPLDCASFFMCSNGVPILQKCPEGLHFNAYLNVCDWPQEANCHQAQGFFGDDIYYEGTQKCPAVDPEEPTGNGGAPYSGGSGDGSASGSGSNAAGCHISPSAIISPDENLYCSLSPNPPDVGKCRKIKVWPATTENWICAQ